MSTVGLLPTVFVHRWAKVVHRCPSWGSLLQFFCPPSVVFCPPLNESMDPNTYKNVDLSELRSKIFNVGFVKFFNVGLNVGFSVGLNVGLTVGFPGLPRAPCRVRCWPCPLPFRSARPRAAVGADPSPRTRVELFALSQHSNQH